MMITDKDGHEKSVASLGLGGTALGLSIGALGIELLRGGGVGNILGGLGCPNGAATATAAVAGSIPGLMQSFYTAHEVEGIKALYDLKDYTDKAIGESDLREANRFYALDKQTDKNFFDIYADYTKRFQVQEQEIGNIKTSLAVLDAVLPYVIKDATCDFVKADKLINSNSIVYNQQPCCGGGYGYYGNYFAPFPPIVTPTTTA